MGRNRKAETPLSKWIDETKGMSRDRLADKLKVARSHVDRLCRGDQKPGLELALKIQQLTGLEPAIWLKPAKAPRPKK